MDIAIAGAIALVSTGAGFAIYKAALAPFAAEADRAAARQSVPALREKKGLGTRIAERLAALFPATSAANAEWGAKLGRAGVRTDVALWHGASIAAAACGAAAGWALTGTLGLGAAVSAVGALTGGAVGWAMPRAVLSVMAKKRQAKLLSSLPAAIELLRITTAAGLQLERGFKEVAEQGDHVGEIADEFAVVRRETTLLGMDFSDALRAMGSRCQVPEVSSFCAAVAQARKQGASVGDVLKSQGDMARSVYFDRIKERINKIAVWIAIPLGVFFLPCAFVLLIAPTVADIMGFLGTLMQ